MAPKRKSSSKNNQENNKVKKKRKAQQTNNLTPEEKAEKQRLQNRLRLLNETPQQRESRLQRLRDYKKSRTPEQIQAAKLKNALYTKQYREDQLNATKTSEEREALLQKRKEYNRNYREKIRSLAKTPEEKEALRLKIINEKRKSVEKLKKLPNRDDQGRLCETVIRSTKKRNVNKEDNLLSLKKRKQARDYMREYRRRKQAAMLEQEMPTSSSARYSLKDQLASALPLVVVDQIKIEPEVLLETNFSPAPNENYFSGSFCSSYFEPSDDSFVTFSTTSDSGDYYCYSTNFNDDNSNTRSYSEKIERRKS